MTDMFNFTTLPPLSLYVHMPWCVRKCPYCDFNSHEVKEALPQQAYIEALLRDLEQDLPRVWGRKVVSVFIGGGTPSLFSPEMMDLLLSGLRARLQLISDAEITLEANPGTVETGKFAEFRATGINRLSIGVQSFNDDCLSRLGRIHGRREAIAAAEQAHKAGFDSFNLDLMFALPQQTLEMAREDVATAIALEPAHLSYYQLTLEANTRFQRQPPKLPDEDQSWAIQRQGQTMLQAAGYAQYEVSAYARTGRQCRHNLNYWKFGDYLGIGAGAHGKISDAQHGSITRLAKKRHPQNYLDSINDGQFIDSERPLTRQEIGFEFMLNAMRLTDGFDSSLFSSHTGAAISALNKALAVAEEKGLIEWDIQSIRPTERGRLFLDDLVGLFLPD